MEKGGRGRDNSGLLESFALLEMEGINRAFVKDDGREETKGTLIERLLLQEEKIRDMEEERKTWVEERMGLIREKEALTRKLLLLGEQKSEDAETCATETAGGRGDVPRSQHDIVEDVLDEDRDRDRDRDEMEEIGYFQEDDMEWFRENNLRMRQRETEGDQDENALKTEEEEDDEEEEDSLEEDSAVLYYMIYIIVGACFALELYTLLITPFWRD